MVASVKDLDQLISSQGSVTFRSFNGKWIGMDCDTDLTFLPNGSIHMFEYGFAVSGYRGTYTMNSVGQVTVQLPTFRGPWPLMLMQKDSTSLLLMPAQNVNGIVMGNRGGATVVGGKGEYWPFRPVDATQEAYVRDRMKQDRTNYDGSRGAAKQ